MVFLYNVIPIQYVHVYNIIMVYVFKTHVYAVCIYVLLLHYVRIIVPYDNRMMYNIIQYSTLHKRLPPPETV